MNHLCPGIGLLFVVGNGNRIELADRIVALQNTGRIFPGNGRSRFYLRPRDFGIIAAAGRPLGNKVINAAFAVLIAGIPVLNGGIFNFGVFIDNNLHNSGMQLILIALRRRTAFQIRHITFIIGNNQRTLKLPGILGINTKISRKFHRTAHAFRNINKRPVGKHGRIQAGKKVVGVRNNGTEIFLHQLGMFFHGLGDGAENNPLFSQFGTISCCHRNAVKYGVHGHHAGQSLLFFQRNAEFGISIQQLGVNFVQAFQRGFLHRRGVIIQILIINLVINQFCPGRFGHRLPEFKSFQPPVEQPFRFAFLCGNQPDNIGV